MRSETKRGWDGSEAVRLPTLRGGVARVGWLGWLLMGCALILALSRPAHAQETGVLDGKVVNGTAGGPLVADGVPVTLHIVQGDTDLDALQTTTDAQGHFAFEGLDPDPALSYYPEATYQDVSYRSADALKFDVQRLTLSATLPVYETTEDGSQVTLDSVHLIAENLGQVLRISEVHVFSNGADRTYIGGVDQAAGGRRTTVVIPLPDGLVGLGYAQGESADRFVQSQESLRDTQPVRPGSATSVVEFSYHLVVSGQTVPVERRFAYPVGMLNVLTVQPGLSLESEQLLAQQPMTFQDKQYGVYSMQGLGAQTPLSMTFVPSTEQAAQSTPSTPTATTQLPASQGHQPLLRGLGFALVGLAVVGALLYSVVVQPRAR